MVFLTGVAAILFVATILLITRTRAGLGFALCFCLYPVFLVAVFIVDGETLLATWLTLAVLNMAIQYVYLRREQVSQGIPSVMFASLFLWPVQYGGVLMGESQRRESAEAAGRQLASIGTLPATITGTVSYAHHIDTEPAEDLVWLEEYPDLELWIDSELYDEIGVAEGRHLSITIEERPDPEGTRRLYIVSGTAHS
jgi:hypothetical protein